MFPPSELDLPLATIKVTPTLHETIHREAADQGMSIPELLWTMLRFFVSGGVIDARTDDLNSYQKSGNSHPSCTSSSEEFRDRKRIWQEDLARLLLEKNVPSNDSNESSVG